MSTINSVINIILTAQSVAMRGFYPSKLGEKIIHHKPVHVEKENFSHGVRISTRDSTSLVQDRNFDPFSEISLSYIDTLDGFVYSYMSLRKACLEYVKVEE